MHIPGLVKVFLFLALLKGHLGKEHGWGMARCVGTALYSAVAPDRNFQYLKELLREGVSLLTDQEYIVQMKDRHDLDRQCCSLGAEPLDPCVLSRSLYLHTLAGRGDWPPRFSLQEEIAHRKKLPGDMKVFNGFEMSAKDY